MVHLYWILKEFLVVPSESKVLVGYTNSSSSNTQLTFWVTFHVTSKISTVTKITIRFQLINCYYPGKLNPWQMNVIQ